MKNIKTRFDLIKGKTIVDLDCPICRNKGLRVVKDKTIDIKDIETAKFEDSLDKTEGESLFYEDYSGLFTAIAVCNRVSCYGRVIMHGKTTFKADYEQDKDGDTIEAYNLEYEIKNIIPSPSIIEYPSETPKEYINQIDVISQQYWTNNEACLNAIRILLELIMNYHKVKRYNYRKGKKRTLVSLHNRIEIFFAKDPKLKNITLALKWLGNEGSHVGRVNKKTVDSSIKILEYILRELYMIDESIEIERFAKKVLRKHK
jgi:hypothetical protein